MASWAEIRRRVEEQHPSARQFLQGSTARQDGRYLLVYFAEEDNLARVSKTAARCAIQTVVSDAEPGVVFVPLSWCDDADEEFFQIVLSVLDGKEVKD